MNAPLSPNPQDAQDAQTFNDRQCRQLGQVYSLILSWRNESKQKNPVKAVLNEKPNLGDAMAKISKQTR